MSTKKSSMSNIDSDIRVPKRYKVILIDNNETTRQFAIAIIFKVFNKTLKEALKIVDEAEKNKEAIVGIYTYDMAYTKVEVAREILYEYKSKLELRIEEE